MRYCLRELKRVIHKQERERERVKQREREKLRVNVLVSKINLGRAEENLNSIRIFHAYYA